ncbi:MAG TPA: type II toxin-antitoxin system VapC family toxin [Thermoanaerobaculia bacterium]|nr:type II toxin-antitoxin system VapC family toxin [Thermoanaerobaculia bacterium]
MRYLLDSNICIYAMKNRPLQVLRRLQNVGRAVVAVSVITVLELRQGAERSQQRELAHARLDDFFGPMDALSFEASDALVAARIRAQLFRIGRPIGDFDSLIAAQALARDLIVVTNNVEEFERVPDLRIENWAE